MLHNGKAYYCNTQSVTSGELVTKNEQLNGNNFSVESLGIITAKPKHPDFDVKTVRLSTFAEWPTHLKQKPTDLAEAGLFYSGSQDIVFCFFCGKGLQQWADNDIPWIEHARWYPDCPYVQTVKGSAFIAMVTENSDNQNTNLQCDSHNNYSDGLSHGQSTGSMHDEYDINNNTAMQSLIQNGYDRVMVTRAIDVWRKEKGDTPYHAADILEIVFDIEDSKVDMNQRKEEQNTSQSVEIDGNITVPTVTQEKKQRHNTQKGICRICRNKIVSVCFLPCGHLVCCIDCAPAYRNCCICGRFVKGTVRTYLA